jgi:hypothetical protein
MRPPRSEGVRRGVAKRMLANSQLRLARFVGALADPKSLRDPLLWEVRYEQMISEIHHCLKLGRES